MAGSRVTQTTVTPLILVILSVVVFMASVGKQGVMAQSSCTGALVSLSPCLNYISGNQTTPSQGCCSALTSVVKNNAPCLCQLLTGNNALGIPINQTRALALPGVCQVTTPPVSQCQGSGAPTTSPSPTASGVPPTSPSPAVSRAPPTSPSPIASGVPPTSPSPAVSRAPPTSPSPTASGVPPTSPSPAVSRAPTTSPSPTASTSGVPPTSHSPAVSGAPTTSPSPPASASGVPPTSHSATSSGAPTTLATPSSNPTQNNSASSIFSSPVLNVVTTVVLAAVVM